MCSQRGKPSKLSNRYTKIRLVKSMRAFLFAKTETPSDAGYPRPKTRSTILAELHSPNTPDFLHGGDGGLPFLVSPHTKSLMRKHALTGFRFSAVEIAKIATKGVRLAKQKNGEPEDVILRA